MNYCYRCMSPLEENQDRCPNCGKSTYIEVPLHHLLPGTVLSGKYMVGKALGEGGFGITYIGRDLTLDMRVAIKEYFPSGYVNRSNTSSLSVSCGNEGERHDFFVKGKERFLNEARTLAKFSNERGIVGVRDFFDANETAYIVMEYLDGVNLKQYLKEHGIMSDIETIMLLKPVMESLSRVHKQNLIHRDISPDNIMLVNGDPKLLDFGAARSVSAVASKSLSVVLKPGYAPEEQYRSKGEQGPWTDVYAICATMYKCITGVTPDDSTQRFYKDELKRPSELGFQINPYIENVIMKGMSVVYTNRYANMDELMTDMYVNSGLFNNVFMGVMSGMYSGNVGLPKEVRELMFVGQSAPGVIPAEVQQYAGQPVSAAQQAYMGQPDPAAQQMYMGQPDPAAQQAYMGQSDPAAQQAYMGQPDPAAQQIYAGQPDSSLIDDDNPTVMFDPSIYGGYPYNTAPSQGDQNGFQPQPDQMGMYQPVSDAGIYQTGQEAGMYQAAGDANAQLYNVNSGYDGNSQGGIYEENTMLLDYNGAQGTFPDNNVNGLYNGFYDNKKPIQRSSSDSKSVMIASIVAASVVLIIIIVIIFVYN